jgi:hypothetical protein
MFQHEAYSESVYHSIIAIIDWRERLSEMLGMAAIMAATTQARPELSKATSERVHPTPSRDKDETYKNILTHLNHCDQGMRNTVYCIKAVRWVRQKNDLSSSQLNCAIFSQIGQAGHGSLLSTTLAVQQQAICL